MRKVVPIRGEERDAATGQFRSGNGGPGRQIRLLHVDDANVAEWMRAPLRTAESRYRGMKLSGLMQRCGTRADGMLRAACVADAVHDALAAHAVTLADVKEARELLAEAKAWAKEARTGWLKLFAMVGVRKGDAGDKDPLARLARELSEGGDDE